MIKLKKTNRPAKMVSKEAITHAMNSVHATLLQLRLKNKTKK
jgi:hypothetical protein